MAHFITSCSVVARMETNANQQMASNVQFSNGESKQPNGAVLGASACLNNSTAVSCVTSTLPNSSANTNATKPVTANLVASSGTSGLSTSSLALVAKPAASTQEVQS